MNRMRLMAAGLVAQGLLIVGLGTGFVIPDYLPEIGTYGVSVGTDNHYCSVDLVHFVPKASCEAVSDS